MTEALFGPQPVYLRLVSSVIRTAAAEDRPAIDALRAPHHPSGRPSSWPQVVWYVVERAGAVVACGGTCDDLDSSQRTIVDVFGAPGAARDTAALFRYLENAALADGVQSVIGWTWLSKQQMQRAAKRGWEPFGVLMRKVV